MRIIITVLSFFIFLLGHCQDINNSDHCFGPGEKLQYVASYTMKGIMTELAGVEMEVINVEGKKKPIYQLKFTANTLKSWDDYVKVRHSYQTYVEANFLKPLIMMQDSDIKGNTTKAKYTFNHKEQNAKLDVAKDDLTSINKTISIKKNTFDIVSLLYYGRDINYAKATVGQEFPLNVLFLENMLSLDFKYLGKDNITVSGMGQVDCYKVAIVLERKFIVDANVTYMWLTADEQKIPVLVSTIFKQGKAEVKLTDYQGVN